MRNQEPSNVACIYLRVSVESQVEDGISLDMQAEVCARYCASHDLIPAAVIRDEGVSSSVPLLRRPAGQQLNHLVEAGEIAHVVAWEQTRLFRDDVEAGTVARLWWELGVTVHLLDLGGAQNLDDPMAEAMYGMRAVFGRVEVRVMRKRVRDAMAHIAATGRAPSGTCYGYRRENKGLVPDPTEAAIVRELYRRFLAGEGIAVIAKDFTSRGVPHKNAAGNPDRLWHPTVIRSILASPIHIGQFRFRGQVLPGTHAPIIDRDEWERAQELLALRSRTGGKQPVHYSALFRCGLCGGRCATRTQQAGSPSVCCALNNLRPDRHVYWTVAERKALAYVWRHTELLLSSDDLARDLETARDQMHQGKPPADTRVRLEDLAARRRQNLEAWQAGAITLSDLQTANAPLVAEEDALRVEADPQQESAPLRVIAALSRTKVTNVLQQIRAASVERQLQFLLSIYSYVAIWRDHVEFHYPDDMLPPEERWFSGYYRPAFGQTDLGF